MKAFVPLGLEKKGCLASHRQPSLFENVQILPELLAAALVSWLFLQAVAADHLSWGVSWAGSVSVFFLFLLTAFGGRVLWNSATLIHGLGHCLIKAWVDQDTSSLALTGILENRSLSTVARSCLPFQQIFLPSFQNQTLPSIALGHAIPWKVRCKASGGLLFNILAIGAASRGYSQCAPLMVGESKSLGLLLLITAMAFFITANALIVLCSVSDLEAIVSGRAERLYCGNFGFIAKKTDPRLEGLIPQYWLDLFKVMGHETEVRGGQAGGGLTLAQDWAGRTHFLGDKIVNPKRQDLTKTLETVFYRTRNQAWRAGFRPRYDTITGVWHYRFGTSGPPSVLETHWHEWTPAHFETVWQIENGKWVSKLQNVNHRITHNGDFEAWQLFGELVDYATLGLWLERVLQVPNATVGDSPKIAGMMDLLITQGMWLPSVRLAYQLVMVSSITDAFGGKAPAREAPNTAPSREQLARWAKRCEAAFIEYHSDDRSPAKDLKPACISDELQQLMVANLQQDGDLTHLEECQICRFAQTIFQCFLNNDIYRANLMFMRRARGSFGLVTVSTLSPNKLVLSSLGQPMVIGVNPLKQYSIYASEPSAVDAVLLHQPETYRVDLNQNTGEIAVLSPLQLQIYSLTENRELEEAEVIARHVPYKQHPYLQHIPKLNSPGIDPIERDLQDIPQILQTIRETWVDPGSLNRQSAEYLLQLLILKAKYLAEKQKKLQSLGLDPDLAQSRHVDILITGVENSLWLGECFAKDLKTIFPLLSIKTLSANVVLQQIQHDFDRLGLAKQSIVFAISQSGQTFPTRQVLHASDLLVRQGVIREFFILTGEPTSFIGSTLARPVYPGETFSRRLFTNKSGRRLAEPATVSVAATHHTLTELLFYLGQQMHVHFPNQNPLGMRVSHESLLVLQGLKAETFIQSAVEILGSNTEGQVKPTSVNRHLIKGGRQWSLHVTETPLVWGIHALYILITVGWAIPFGYSIPLVQTLIRGILLVFDLSGTTLLARLLLASGTLADIGIYIFGPWFWILGLRFLQKRQLFARTGKRTLVIGDLPWVQHILKIYVSKLFSLSYGITSLEVQGADPQDHLVHQFGHRVIRGTLLFLGFPDGRCSEKQRNEENAVLMTARQAKGIQHLRTGPEVVAVGSNPMLANQGFAQALLLPSPTHQNCEDGEKPPLTNNLVESLRESRYGSFRRLLASYVFFWALAKRVGSFPLLQYPFWRSQSRTKIMTTAAPVSATTLDRPEPEEISILDLPALANREQS
ncbi:MAG: hypothetical protein ACO37W_05905 [Prochlorotrichaceae cyanobacterium]